MTFETSSCVKPTTRKRWSIVRISLVTCALLASLLITPASYAQAQTHKVTLTWVDASNPSGTTYSVYRSTGLCSGTPTFSKLATGVAALTYVDSTVTPGNYCYQVTATASGLESAPSNSVNPAVQPFTVVLSFTVQ